MLCVNFIISSYEKGPTLDRARYLRLFPLRVLHHYHETGKSKAYYQSGTRWCTSFRKNVNKTLATKTTYKKSGEKTLDILKGCHLLLHILGLQTSSIYLINNKINDDIILTCVHEKITNLKKNNHAKWRWSAMQNSVGVQPDSMDGQCD